MTDNTSFRTEVVPLPTDNVGSNGRKPKETPEQKKERLIAMAAKAREVRLTKLAQQAVAPPLSSTCTSRSASKKRKRLEEDALSDASSSSASSSSSDSEDDRSRRRHRKRKSSSSKHSRRNRDIPIDMIKYASKPVVKKQIRKQLEKTTLPLLQELLQSQMPMYDDYQYDEEEDMERDKPSTAPVVPETTHVSAPVAPASYIRNGPAKDTQSNGILSDRAFISRQHTSNASKWFS